jgi:predicted phage terminase large subunit-like protein
VTGYGAGLIVIDDPVKSRAEAESQTYRDNIWDWFNDDLYTRLEPNGAIILIQTRWHEDDLAGRLLREAAEEGGEQWEVVNLPALAEGAELRNADRGSRNEEKDVTTNGHEETRKDLTTTNPHSAIRIPHSKDPLGRPPGEALCAPSATTKPLSKSSDANSGSYSFAALYQQRPVRPRAACSNGPGSGPFRSLPPASDGNAATTSPYRPRPTADYTASFRAGYDREGNLYIDGGFRRRIAYPEQRRFILGRIAAETDTEHGVELSVNGHAVIQDLRRESSLQGRAFRGVRITGDKVSRALPWIALAEEGRVFLVRGSWNTEFIDEACSFPAGTHDDQIDAVSVAIQMHRQQNKRVYGF